MRQIALLLTVVVALSLVKLCWADDAAETSDKNLREDLAQLQGKWERRTEAFRWVEGREVRLLFRVVKEIKGEKAVITYFDEKGGVRSVLEADLELSRVGDLRFVKYTNAKYTKGPKEGKTAKLSLRLFTVKKNLGGSALSSSFALFSWHLRHRLLLPGKGCEVGQQVHRFFPYTALGLHWR